MAALAPLSRALSLDDFCSPQNLQTRLTADRPIVYKQCLKEVAEQTWLSVSFMANLCSYSRRITLSYSSQSMPRRLRIDAESAAWMAILYLTVPLHRAGFGFDWNCRKGGAPIVLFGNLDGPMSRRVHKSLAEAVALFANSDFAKRAFGDEVVEHYAHFFKAGQDAFNSAVTN